MTVEAATAVQTAGDPWRSYLDRMGKNTREYIEERVEEGLEFGRGILGSPTNLRHIAEISQSDDGLGVLYICALCTANLGTVSILENRKTIEAIKGGKVRLDSIIGKLRAGKYKDVQTELRLD